MKASLFAVFILIIFFSNCKKNTPPVPDCEQKKVIDTIASTWIPYGPGDLHYFEDNSGKQFTLRCMDYRTRDENIVTSNKHDLECEKNILIITKKLDVILNTEIPYDETSNLSIQMNTYKDSVLMILKTKHLKSVNVGLVLKPDGTINPATSKFITFHPQYHLGNNFYENLYIINVLNSSEYGKNSPFDSIFYSKTKGIIKISEAIEGGNDYIRIK